MNKNNNLIPLLVIFNILLIGLSLYFGYFYFRPISPPFFSDNHQVACPLDAKICPDGTSVGRLGPDCEFAPCPDSQSVESGSDISTYTFPDGSFMFTYFSNLFTYVKTEKNNVYLATKALDIPLNLSQEDLWLNLNILPNTGQEPISKVSKEFNGPQIVYSYFSQIIKDSQVYQIEMSSFNLDTLRLGESAYDLVLSSFQTK